MESFYFLTLFYLIIFLLSDLLEYRNTIYSMTVWSVILH